MCSPGRLQAVRGDRASTYNALLPRERDAVKPHLAKLNPHPFERLRKLFEGVAPPPGKKPIVVPIGEPKHPTPALTQQALIDGIPKLANYPITSGLLSGREAISA